MVPVEVLTPRPRRNTDACVCCFYSGGLGAFPAHVIGLGSFDLECVNCGHTVLEHVIDRRKYEDEDDVRFGESQNNFVCKYSKHKRWNTQTPTEYKIAVVLSTFFYTVGCTQS